MDLPWTDQDKALALIGRDTPFNLYWVQANSTRRAITERFIEKRFAEQYAAKIHHFMPSLFSLENQHGELVGAVGLRSAGRGPLFLERYLEHPTEQIIGALQGMRLPEREHIVEVGNLAAVSAGAGRLLIVALTDLLVSCGFRWVTFTGTPALLNSFQRLGLAPLSLGRADPACMGDELADWGCYYDSEPHVMIGDIAKGHQRLLQLGAYPRMAYQPYYALEDIPDVACS